MSIACLAAGLFCLCALAGCSDNNKPLPMVKDNDPVVQLNPERWSATVNDLLRPTPTPTEAAP